MSQPPQNGWGQPPSGEPYGQPSPNSGYGQGQGGYGQDQPGGYGQDQPGGYGQDQFGGNGQDQPSGYGQDQPGGYGQEQFGAYGQDQAGGYGQPSPNGGYGQQGGFGQDASYAPAFGDTGGGFAPQGPEKKGPGKLPFLICAGCALLALLLVIVGGGIFLFVRTGDEETGGGGDETTQSEPADEETSEEPTDEPTSEDPTDEATEEQTSEEATDEAAADDAGTQDDPYALGETFTLEDGEGGTLDVTIGEVNWDATDEVMKASGGNTEPGDDETYILVPVKLTYHGSGTAEPGFSMMVEYVSGAGNTYSDEYAVTPKDWVDVGSLHDGGTGEWQIGMIVPKDQVKDGAFTVQAMLDFTADPVWVAAA